MKERKFDAKRIAQIHRELYDLKINKMKIFHETRERIFTNTEQYEKYDYNDRSKIKESKLHLELLKNEVYQKITKDINELEAEQIELEDIPLSEISSE